MSKVGADGGGGRENRVRVPSQVQAWVALMPCTIIIAKATHPPPTLRRQNHVLKNQLFFGMIVIEYDYSHSGKHHNHDYN